METKYFHAKPNILAAFENVSKNSVEPSALGHIRFLNGRHCRYQESKVLAGDLKNEHACFHLYSFEKQKLQARIVQPGASCYYSCKDALAIGCVDGTVKIWNFSISCAYATDGLHETSSCASAPPSHTISHRSSLAIVPFLKSRSKERIVQLHMDHSGFLNLATATERGEAHVWDVNKGETLISFAANKIHKSALSRTRRDASLYPTVTKLMLTRTTLVCGTSAGLIRIFDLRSGKLTHRLAGHPEHVTHVDSRGRVLYSAGNEGSVRWWGGKAAKVLEKSAICEGRISVLEMNDDVIVAGYSRQGMQAWDVRTQQPLCTFSNADVGGVRSLQFDNRKLVTVSTTGKATLWRWYSSHPVQMFDPIEPNSAYVSAQFNDFDLIFGTSCGKLVQYNNLSMM